MSPPFIQAKVCKPWSGVPLRPVAVFVQQLCVCLQLTEYHAVVVKRLGREEEWQENE